MDQNNKAVKIVRLKDGSRRVRLRVSAEVAGRPKFDVGDIQRPARGFEVRVLAHSGQELTVDVVLAPSTYEALVSRALRADKPADEFVEASIRRVLERPEQRSHDEALALTREFIKANQDWLRNKSF